jgi:purine-binding chemotaxis protein CheW
MGDTQPTKTKEQTPRQAQDQLQLVTFAVGDVDLAVDILSVREITRVRNLARVPHSPEGVEGVISLRGGIIPVIDLAPRLDQPARERTEHGRIIIVEIRSQTVGLIATQVHDVVRIDRSEVAPAPPMLCPIDSDCIAGFVKLARRPVTLLNLDALIDEPLERALAQSLDDARLTAAEAPPDGQHADPPGRPNQTRPSKLATT